MKKWQWLTIGGLALAAAVLAVTVWDRGVTASYVAQTQKSEGRDPAHLAMWEGRRREARQDVTDRLTNDVIGLSRVIEIAVSDRGVVVSKWSARATVEFVNRAGGVERTNLMYRFDAAGGHIGAWRDTLADSGTP